jgi:hypothetical protein
MDSGRAMAAVINYEQPKIVVLYLSTQSLGKLGAQRSTSNLGTVKSRYEGKMNGASVARANAIAASLGLVVE